MRRSPSMRRPSPARKEDASKDVTETAPDGFAQTFAHETQVGADLRLILDRWPALPEAVRAGMVAMVKSASR